MCAGRRFLRISGRLVLSLTRGFMLSWSQVAETMTAFFQQLRKNCLGEHMQMHIQTHNTLKRNKIFFSNLHECTYLSFRAVSSSPFSILYLLGIFFLE